MSGPVIAWRVDRWGKQPIRKEYVRETERCYFYLDICGKERRTAKTDSYSTHYATEQAALDAIAARNARADERKNAERVRDAAPDLLEALQMVRDYVVTMKGAGHEYQVAIDAAIARATGEQP